MASIRVWDPLVRVLHWSLLGSITTAWLATLHIGLGALHEPAGYVALGVVTTRMIWGIVGGRHARFTQFILGPAQVWRYARLVVTHQEPRHVGHNPLGGWMVLALLSDVAATGLTGWLQTTDRYWGSEGLERVHTALAWSLLGLVALHVTGVIFTSVRHRENLVTAMFTGRKVARPGDETG